MISTWRLTKPWVKRHCPYLWCVWVYISWFLDNETRHCLNLPMFAFFGALWSVPEQDRTLGLLLRGGESTLVSHLTQLRHMEPALFDYCIIWTAIIAVFPCITAFIISLRVPDPDSHLDARISRYLLEGLYILCSCTITMLVRVIVVITTKKKQITAQGCV